MDIELILNSLIAKSDIVMYILSALGSLVVLGTVYVKMTPSKGDDEQLAKIESIPVIGTLLKVLEKFSPVARKVVEKEES